VALVPRAAAAASDADPRRAQAERLAREGRCAAALDVFEELRAEHPDEGSLLLESARCEIQLHRYERAVETLREAKQRDPENGEIRLRLAIALYHLDDVEGAAGELDAAERRLGENDAELLLYRGLLLLERGDAASASTALERARALDPAVVEPVASYYAAVACVSLHDRACAEAHIARVLEQWPETGWAAQAEQLRARLASERLRRWARLEVGFEYDSNAVLQGNGTPLPTDISSQRDERGVWSLEAGSELFRGDRWSGGVLAAYNGSAYSHVTQFDSNYPTAAAWLDRRLDEATTVRAMLDSGFAWVDGDAFLWDYRASLSLLRSWDRFGFSELYTRFHRDDFFTQSDDVQGGNNGVGNRCTPFVEICGPPGLDERSARNRDGNGVVVGIHHTVKLPFDALLRAGYEYEHFSARGSEYSFDAYSVVAGVFLPLPYRFALDLNGDFTHRPFRHPSTFPNLPAPQQDIEYGLGTQDRLENYYEAGVRLERPIARHVSAAVAWRYERNRSNVDVFDYHREVIGVYLSVALGN